MHPKMDAWGFTAMLATLPVIAGLVWWWNDLWYALPVKHRLARSNKKLPPGHMGLPFIGELITFLWYFKIVGRPDDYIDSKRNKYGDGVGLYRTYLFGKPTIIACSAASSRFVLRSDEAFCLPRWPTNDLVGPESMIAANGERHRKLRSFVTGAINHPKALRNIALVNQQRIVASLNSWADRGTIVSYDEVKKITFANIGKLFVSFEPGPLLDKLDYYFRGMLAGMRANPVNFPGTTYHHALQCRKKLVSIFRRELEKKKQNRKNGCETTNDLMDGLMQIKDEDGNFLSDEEVVDNIASLVVGGYESVTLSTMWSIYYLAKYPDVLAKLREENMVMLKKKNGEFITIDDISNMEYTVKVVDEVVRVANVSTFVFRGGDRDVEFQGHVIPKGWKVICWLRYLHTNPRNFENPWCFNPDRYGPVKPEGYQVFGGGVKICAGNKFARIQIAIFLHHLVTGYKWELINPDAKMIYLPNLKPVDGAKIAISRL